MDEEQYLKEKEINEIEKTLKVLYLSTFQLITHSYKM